MCLCHSDEKQVAGVVIVVAVHDEDSSGLDAPEHGIQTLVTKMWRSVEWSIDRCFGP